MSVNFCMHPSTSLPFLSLFSNLFQDLLFNSELSQQYLAGNEAAIEVEARAEMQNVVTQGCEVRS
ncbi:hypothetical protein BJX62DRAFT_237229 [Aspergillus germanicus]